MTGHNYLTARIRNSLRLVWKFKNLLLVVGLGVTILAIGFAYLLVWIYRHVYFNGQFQHLIYFVTLQFVPHVWRFVILTAVGLGIVLWSLQEVLMHVLAPFRQTDGNLADQLQSYQKRVQGPRIVVIGGGIGTAQLVRGLKEHAGRISVVVHMTDDGGSAGRLRRSLGIPPLGDIVSNIVALSDMEELMKELLVYRFKGDRYGSDNDLGGHKVGNLLFAALADITGDLNTAIAAASRIFAVRGEVLPVTLENVFLHASTRDGVEVSGEENIDLGKYEGGKVLEKIWCEPKDVPANPRVLEAIRKADVIILGPGDLYTTILASLIFPEVVAEIKHSQAFKAYVLNVANKPYETRGFELADFIEAFKRHGAEQCFDYIFVNKDQSLPIPATPEYDGYSFVQYDVAMAKAMGYKIVEGEFLEATVGGKEGKSGSLYHDPKKIAKAILNYYHECCSV